MAPSRSYALRTIVRVLIAKVFCLSIFIAGNTANADPMDATPSSAITVGVVPAISSTKWLPETPVPNTIPSNMWIRGSPTQRVVGSLLVRVSSCPCALTIAGTIPVKTAVGLTDIAVNVRYVKPWFQSGTAWKGINRGGERILVPELLLHDDDLVRVDLEKRENLIRVTHDGQTRHLNENELLQLGTTEPHGYGRVIYTPDKAIIKDAEHTVSLQITPNETRQVWLDFEIPPNAQAGAYDSAITIARSGGERVSLPIMLSVNGFRLNDPAMIYGIYYRGLLHDGPSMMISEWKTAHELAVDFRNMEEHGITHPTIRQYWNQRSELDQVLKIRSRFSFSKDEIYYLGANLTDPLRSHNASRIRERVRAVVPVFARHGSNNIYFYGIDEGKTNDLELQRPGWKVIHSLSQKVFVAGWREYLEAFAGLIDTVVVAYQPDWTIASKVHKAGGKILSYANPQTGVENPEVFRRNYGVSLWRADYDGAMLYAYQHSFGSSWNDFDGAYRDHSVAYPATNGVIDTLAWEGFREATYDVRYIRTLEGLLGAVKTELCDDAVATYKAKELLRRLRLTEPTDLDGMRGELADRISELVHVRQSCKS